MWTLCAYELQSCRQVPNQICILKDSPDPSPEILQVHRMAGWPEAIMQVGCHQKGVDLEDTVSTFYTAASCRQCRHTWIVRAAETETEEDVDVEEEAVSMMCAAPISSQWQACCTLTQSFCCFSFQILLSVPGLGWGLAGSHEQQPHLRVESLSSRKQHGCVRQLCFVNAQPRLRIPALDTSYAPYLCCRRCGSGKSPL